MILRFLALSILVVGCVQNRTKSELLIKKPRTAKPLIQLSDSNQDSYSLAQLEGAQGCDTILKAVNQIHRDHLNGTHLHSLSCKNLSPTIFQTRFTISRHTKTLSFQLDIKKLQSIGADFGSQILTFDFSMSKLDSEEKLQAWNPREETYLMHVNLFHLEKTLQTLLASKRTFATKAYCKNKLGRSFNSKTAQCVYREGKDIGLADQALKRVKNTNDMAVYLDVFTNSFLKDVLAKQERRLQYKIERKLDQDGKPGNTYEITFSNLEQGATLAFTVGLRYQMIEEFVELDSQKGLKVKALRPQLQSYVVGIKPAKNDIDFDIKTTNILEPAMIDFKPSLENFLAKMLPKTSPETGASAE